MQYLSHIRSLFSYKLVRVVLALSVVLAVFTFHTILVHAVDGETTYTGTNTNLNDDDESAGPLDLGFDFTFYGTTYAQAYANINGTLNFDSGYSEYQNGSLDTMGANDSIYAFWDDLVTNDVAPIYYATIGTAPNREFIMQWTNMYFYNTSIQMGTFQAILYEGSNDIQLQYRDLLGGSRAEGDSATIGIKKDGTTFSQYSNNTASLTQGQAIRYSPDGSNAYTVNTNATYDPVYLAPVGAPGSPVLINPTDGTTGSTVTPTFEWDAVPSATNYVLLVSTASDFSSTVVNQDGITDTSYTLGSALNFNTTYYWRVQAVNDDGSNLSSSRTFTTSSVANADPDTPTSVSSSTLASGKTLSDLTGDQLNLSLSDSDSGQDVRYRIQIASDSGFLDPIIDYRSAFGSQGAVRYTFGETGGTYLTGSSSTVLPDGDYYIRVRAEDDASASSSWYVVSGIAFTLDSSATPIPTDVPLPTSSSQSSDSSSPNSMFCPIGYVFCPNAGPIIKQPTMITSDSGGDGAEVFVNSIPGTMDLVVKIEEKNPTNLITIPTPVPFPWQQGFNTVGEIYTISATSAFNGYPVAVLDHPVTIIMYYDQTKLNGHMPKDLRIGWFNPNTHTWEIIKNNTVVKPEDHLIANTTTHMGYFAVVYPRNDENISPVLGASTKKINKKTNSKTQKNLH